MSRSGYNICRSNVQPNTVLQCLSIECFGISKIAEARDPLRKDYLNFICDINDGYEHTAQRCAEANILRNYDLTLDKIVALSAN